MLIPAVLESKFAIHAEVPMSLGTKNRSSDNDSLTLECVEVNT